MLTDPRARAHAVTDSLWVRLVDVAGGARPRARYAVDPDVVIEVAD